LGRIVLLLVIGFLIYLLLRGFWRSQVKREDAAPLATTSAGEDMVTCARCGVNLPRSEALEQGDKLVCRDNPNCKSLT